MKGKIEDAQRRHLARRELARGLIAVSLCAALLGCVSGSLADRHFDSGDYAAAAGSYEYEIEQGLLPEAERARALFRLALIYGALEDTSGSQDKASLLLEELRQEHPASLYGRQAAHILELRQAIELLRFEVDDKQEWITSLSRRLAEMQTGSDDSEEEQTASEERIARLSRIVSKLQGDIQTLEDELAAQAAEFEQLKAIDLTTPP